MSGAGGGGEVGFQDRSKEGMCLEHMDVNRAEEKHA